jgi:hypothetical protein
LKALIVLLIIIISAPVLSQRAVFFAANKSIRFPKTKEGEILKYRYYVKNIGKAPLMFYGFEAECTCTEVVLPKKAINPGEGEYIDVSFNTNGKYFFQDRVVYLATNTKRKREKLRFKVFVIPKD